MSGSRCKSYLFTTPKRSRQSGVEARWTPARCVGPNGSLARPSRPRRAYRGGPYSGATLRQTVARRGIGGLAEPLTIYHLEDLARALERAVRSRAFSYPAVERILAAQARPRSAMEALVIEAREQLNQVLHQAHLGPTAEDQPLLDEVANDENDEGEDMIGEICLL